ncbi:MFS-type transporter SLC18B1 [Hypsibius exemplaris]|uniref:MFS-type transporter SLC18B1 n=1 Tax=Hypsibius exemplaris TaxID=2072580 RepID=A0A1W0WGW2_HYPEX|nr:MFS-type transporter SLC18B1 [Hypsibius exemplaris]
MQYDSPMDGGDDVWEPRTSWVLPSLHRNSRRVMSDVGRAARYASGGMFRPQMAGNVQRRTSWNEGFGRRTRSMPGGMEAPSSSSVESSTNSSEEAFSLLRMNRDEKKTLLCLAVVDLFSYLCMSIMAPFFPAKVEAVGASQTVSGGVFAVYALTVFISSPIFAKLVPVVGAKFTFVAGIFVAGSCNILFGLLEDVNDPFTFTILAFIIRIVEGAGAGAFCTASFTILAYEFSESGGVAVVFGTLEAFVGLGMTIGPALGGALFTLGGFKLPFFVVGSMMLLTVPLNIWLLPTQRHVVTKPKKGSQSKFFKNPSVYVVCFTILVIASVWGFLDPTLQPHLLQFNLSSAMVGLLFLLLSATYAISSPIWGWLAEKAEDTDILMVVGLIISGGALLCLGPSPFLQLPEVLWLNIVSLAVLGSSISLALIPTFESLLSTAEQAGMADNIGTYALVSGVWGSAYSLGEVVGPALGGFLDELYGFPICSTVMSAICLVTAVLFGVYLIVDRFMDQLEKRRNAAAHLARKAAIASWRVETYRTRDGMARNLMYPASSQQRAYDETASLTGSLQGYGYGTDSRAAVIDASVYVNIPTEREEEDIPSIAVSV